MRTRARIGRLVAVGAALGGLLLTVAPAHARTRTEIPEPQESIKATVDRLKRALRSTKCQVRGQVLLHSSRRVDPTAPNAAVPPMQSYSTEECDDIAAFAEQLRGFKPKRSKAYGTGAIVEGTLDGQPFAMTFVLDVDGKWRAVAGGPLAAQIGTTPELDYATSAQSFVHAMATSNCLTSWAYLAADSPYVTARASTGGYVQWCTDVVASAATGQGRIYDLIAATSQPEQLGATLDVAFYGIELPSGRYVTLVLFSQLTGVTDHLNPGVFDYVTNRGPTP